ncbi:hypothetical protein DRQ33_00210 [bacterium]|nr:MAG: hypothetical protein DRQ33_00210 [bacterium]
MRKGKIIIVRGDALEMGITQGKFLRQEIQKGWEIVYNYPPINKIKPTYLPTGLFLFGAGIWANSFLSPTFQVFPTFYERFEGICQGAEISHWKLALIHFIEVAGSDSPRQLMGCSSVAVVPPRSDEPILVKNFDFVDDFIEFNIIRQSFTRWGYSSAEFTMAPISGSHTGINEAGLAITYNYGYSKEKPQKAPLLTARVQEILNTCETVRDTVNILRRKPNPGHGIITVVDSNGDAVAIELSPLGTGIVEAEDGIIANANLYHNPQMQKRLIPLDAVYGENAPEYMRGVKIQETNVIRTERLNKLLSKNKKIDMDILKTILSDHGENNHPDENTICRHHENFSTHLSAIMLPRSRKMYYIWGQPCKTDKWQEMRM